MNQKDKEHTREERTGTPEFAHQTGEKHQSFIASKLYLAMALASPRVVLAERQKKRTRLPDSEKASLIDSGALAHMQWPASSRRLPPSLIGPHTHTTHYAPP